MDSTLADFDVFDLWSHINTMMETYQESYVYEVSTMLYFRWFMSAGEASPPVRLASGLYS
jgi:hypothetical protein